MNNEERDRRVMLALKQLGIELTTQAYCDEWYRQFGAETPDFEIAASSSHVATDTLQLAFAELKRRNSVLLRRADHQFGEIIPDAFVVPQNPLRTVDARRVREMAMCLRPAMRREEDRPAIRRELLNHGYVANDQEIEAIILNQRASDAVFAGDYGAKK